MANRKSKIESRRFVMGPMFIDWLTPFMQMNGKATQLALAIHYLKGMKKSNKVKLTHSVLKDFCISRQAAHRILRTMAESGFISIEIRRGCSPVVTIIERNHDQTSVGSKGESDE